MQLKQNTVDPRTTWIWSAWVHLYTNFVNKYILQYYTIRGLLTLRMENLG